MAIQIYRDQYLITTVENETQAWSWIHSNHSFSVSHALKYEGYRFVEVDEMPTKPALQKYHLTENGCDSLCGINGMKIHRTYADRILDCGQWCENCQEINRQSL